MNVGQLALDNIEKYGEYTSLVFEGTEYTNVALDLHAGKMAAALRDQGIGLGDNVLVMMTNNPDTLAAFQACWKLGAVIIPVTPMLNAREVGFLLDNSESKVAITSPVLAGRVKEASQGAKDFKQMLVVGQCDVEGAVDIAAAIEAADPVTTLAERDDDDMALLLYTSGTTGNPKGVMLTHGNLLSNARSVAGMQVSAPYMKSLLVLPLSHSFGVLMMDLGHVLGTSYTLLTHWDTEKVFQAIQDFKVERFSIVPTMLSYMVNFPDRNKFDTSTLERVNTGGSALMNDLRMEFEKVFNCTVKEGYGLSETSPSLTGYHEDVPYRPGSVGQAIPEVEVCILDFEDKPVAQGKQGEICAKGPNIMSGYWKMPEATETAMAGGWFHSGDIGYVDEEGFVFITDRKKDLIIKGGENISPREIEEALQEHSAVAEGAVVGVPDPTFGENIVAVVVLKPDAEASEEEILEHIGKFVTKFKIPCRVEYMDVLPKNPTGKIQKRAIKQQILKETPTS